MSGPEATPGATMLAEEGQRRRPQPSGIRDPTLAQRLDERLNRFVRHVRASRFRWDPRAHGPGIDDVPVDRPIFLLGVQGGGLTLLARILHRAPGMITVGGDHRSWTGEDELQVWIREGPPHLGLRSRGFGNEVGNELDHPTFGTERSWVYACSELYDLHRFDEREGRGPIGELYRRTLQRILRVHSAGHATPRFLDKSQTNTLRVPFLETALAGSRPRYVIVTRDPYTLCWRDLLMARRRRYRYYHRIPTPEEHVRWAAEHWHNSFQTALGDTEDMDRAITIRFEDALMNLEATMRQVLKVCDVPFDGTLLPGPGQRMPLGTAPSERHKWYPLRPDVNDRWRADVPAWAIDIIEATCDPLARRLGYEPPSPEEER